jgi:hypothetical protein
MLQEDDLVSKRTITYAEFDVLHDEMAELSFCLFEVTVERPLNEGLSTNFAIDIAKIIAASDNVLPFIRPSPDQ